MKRLLGSAVVTLLLAAAVGLPYTTLGRRGDEASLRVEVETEAIRVGSPLPELHFVDLDGTPVRLSNFRGKRVLLTFERSVDW